jgi:hypothetical protein
MFSRLFVMENSVDARREDEVGVSPKLYAEMSEALMRIGEELGLTEVSAFNCIDAIRSLKRALDPSGAVAWALVQEGAVLHTTHDAKTAAYMKEANANCQVKPLLLADREGVPSGIAVADFVKFARNFPEGNFNGAPGFIRGIAYASEYIASEIEEAIHHPEAFKSKWMSS